MTVDAKKQREFYKLQSIACSNKEKIAIPHRNTVTKATQAQT